MLWLNKKRVFAMVNHQLKSSSFFLIWAQGVLKLEDNVRPGHDHRSKMLNVCDQTL